LHPKYSVFLPANNEEDEEVVLVVGLLCLLWYFLS
jgi:hypothetical protein